MNVVLVACVLEHIFYFINFLHILFELLLLFKYLFFVYYEIAERISNLGFCAIA